MSPREIIQRSPVRFVTVSALGIALTFVSTRIGFPMPDALGGYFHLGHIPLFLFAMVFGREVGAVTGGIGMSLFDFTSPYAVWGPFTLLISALLGYVSGTIGEKKTGWGWNLGAILITIPIKVIGYYLAEALLYGNWIMPMASVPSNVIQVVIAAVIVLPLIRPMKLAAARILKP